MVPVNDVPPTAFPLKPSSFRKAGCSWQMGAPRNTSSGTAVSGTGDWATSGSGAGKMEERFLIRAPVRINTAAARSIQRIRRVILGDGADFCRLLLLRWVIFSSPEQTWDLTSRASSWSRSYPLRPRYQPSNIPVQAYRRFPPAAHTRQRVHYS